MRRRELITLAGGAAVAGPRASLAQSKPARLGVVFNNGKIVAAPQIEAIVSGVRAAGYPVEQLEVVARFADGDPARFASLMAEVVASNVTVLVVNGPAMLKAARAVTRTIPFVILDLESDPIATGVAASLAHPGGNATGVYLDYPDFSAKWLELLCECVPQLSRIAVIWNPAIGPLQVEAIRKAADGLKLPVDVVEVHTRGDFDAAFSLADQNGAGAAILTASPLVFGYVEPIAALALRYRLPAITLYSAFARAGGLLAYGPNLTGLYAQLGVLVGKMLRGQDVANLPIERPTRFELLLNQRTAQALGLTIPRSILGRADEVIE